MRIDKSQLEGRAEAAWQILKDCQLCPRRCRVNRLEGEQGYCRSGHEPVVSSFAPHFGEEPELVGRDGSGAIFFAGCNLGCIFCQNYEISHYRYGEVTNGTELSNMMLSLQKRGCHNINFVTPTHFVPQILKALVEAVDKGLTLPLVYNCGGYESLETLKLLEGIFDIYMPDMKYNDPKISARFSDAPDYPEIARQALKEMHRQVGDLSVDKDGIAQRGLMVRHLILPNGLAGTEEILEFISKKISLDTYVNIMDQYKPCYKAVNYKEINRFITRGEYQEAIRFARSIGLHRGF